MSHHRPTLFLTALLLTIAVVVPTLATARAGVDEQVEALHKEITSLRVIHGLQLDDEQLDALVPLVEEGIGLVDDLRAADADNQRASLVVLRAVRDDLQRDGEVSEATREALQDHGDVCEAKMRPIIQELHLLAEEVMAVLDDDQQAQVHEALGRAPWEKRAERRARRGGKDARSRAPALPPEAQGELRRHNARKLFGLVFSEEFLAVLQ